MENEVEQFGRVDFGAEETVGAVAEHGVGGSRGGGNFRGREWRVDGDQAVTLDGGELRLRERRSGASRSGHWMNLRTTLAVMRLTLSSTHSEETQLMEPTEKTAEPEEELGEW